MIEDKNETKMLLNEAKNLPLIYWMNFGLFFAALISLFRIFHLGDISSAETMVTIGVILNLGSALSYKRSQREAWKKDIEDFKEKKNE